MTAGTAPNASAVATGLLVSDVDSTFLTQEVIELVAEHAGVRDRVEEITTAAMRGELDFSQSLRARVALLEGLEESVLAEVRAVLVPTPGALELVRRAKDAGWVVALVSGGFHEVIDDLAAEAGIDHVRANRFEIVDGRFTGAVRGPIIDGTAKRRTLEELAERHGVPAQRIVAMGDGANDREMLLAAGTGIAFRAKPALREVADVTIDGESLLEAWQHLESAASRWAIRTTDGPGTRCPGRPHVTGVRGARWCAASATPPRASPTRPRIRRGPPWPPSASRSGPGRPRRPPSRRRRAAT